MKYKKKEHKQEMNDTAHSFELDTFPRRDSIIERLASAPQFEYLRRMSYGGELKGLTLQNAHKPVACAYNM